mgnify:FL=1
MNTELNENQQAAEAQKPQKGGTVAKIIAAVC